METHPLITTLEEAVHGLTSSTLGDASGHDSGTNSGADADHGFPLLSDVQHLSNTDLITAVQTAEALGRLVDTLRVEVAHEVDARTMKKPAEAEHSLAHSLGFPNANALLQQVTLVSPATVAKRLRTAKPCTPRVSLHGEELPAKHPHIGAAFRAGAMSLDAVEVLTSRFQKLSPTVPHDYIDYVEQVLVSHATGNTCTDTAFDDLGAGVPQGSPGHPLHAGDLKVLADAWMAVLDQEGSEPREEEITRRYFTIGTEHDGLVRVHGALLPEVAATLGRTIDAIVNPRAGKNRDGASNVGFVTTDDNGDRNETEQFRDERTHAQKRHDAFATIVNTAMKHADMPSYNGEALSLTIQVTEDDLTNPQGPAWVHDAHGTLTPLPTAAARHAGCTGGLLRVTQDGTEQIKQLETHDRVFNAHQRKAILLRDGGCIIPGCTQPAPWCEVHHVTKWSKGGKTHTGNGVALCWYHHRYIEQHEWDIRMVDGIPEVKAPPWLDPNQKWREASSVHKQPQKPATWRAKTRVLKQPATLEPSLTHASKQPRQTGQTLGCTAPPQQVAYPPAPRAAPARQASVGQAPARQLNKPPSRRQPASRPMPDISWASEHVPIIVTD